MSEGLGDEPSQSGERRSRLGRLSHIAQRTGALRRFALPGVILALALVVFALFREILLPFIFAVVIVYLMHPLVRRMAARKVGPVRVPRWVAVILVYLAFLGVVGTATVLIVPRFVSEIVRLGESVPEQVREVRETTVPAWNARLQALLSAYAPALSAPDKEASAPERRAARRALAARRASAALAEARRRAETVAFARSAVFLARRVRVRGEPGFPDAIAAEYDGADLARLARRPSNGSWRLVPRAPGADLRVVPDGAGGFEVYLGALDLEVERAGEGLVRVRRGGGEGGAILVEEEEAELGEILDLERGLDELIEGLAVSSNARLASVITYARSVVVGVIEAFVALVLTLMIAAFITIDLERLMAFLRGLIPPEHRASYDALLGDLDRGLGGVVRGQLMICLVNGALTYIGLAILGIKFSVLLGVMAGVLSIIPIFGTILSTVPIVLFGLTDGLTTGVLALGWILAIHFVEANILNPKIIGTSAHIHPVIVIFALLAGESAFGLVGALLAVPTASILLTLFRFFVSRSESGRRALEAMEET